MTEAPPVPVVGRNLASASQHRAGSPDCFDGRGRHRKGRCPWVCSSEARATAGRLLEAHRRKAEHRTSLHGNLANRVFAQGTTIHAPALRELGHRHDIGGAPGPGRVNQRVPAVARLVPAAAGGAGGAE